ncbi:LytTr DNA-binding domain-containing protein [Spirosoma oryzae]|uniref:LytTr DNA-binding domain-containing protein n=2 Tax=Spirosoma oryzae TaxID=1469603 RepID=A0A2T0SVZ3_9BACT|nr:LytTr DNA-binding domain-containing protein [Spirosoma oryzae]
MSPLPLTFRTRGSWPYIALLLLLCILVFQFVSIRHNSSNNAFTSLVQGDIGAYAKGLLYYIPVEFITVCVILVVLVLYKKWLRLDSLYPTAVSLLKYEIIFLPAILGSIIFVCPITNAVRYAFLYVNHYSWRSYYPDFFFTWRMYFNYLLSVLFFSYAYLNANLMLDYIDWHQAIDPAAGTGSNESTRVNDTEREEKLPVLALTEDQKNGIEKGTINSDTESSKLPVLQIVEVYDGKGSIVLPVDTIVYFDVQGKVYRAYTERKEYKLRKTILELEQELDSKVFFRISRGVIVNTSFIANYSHWEYDKFIIRLSNSSKEFVMQRKRLSALKACLSGRYS